jgi:hypothetical protein
MGQGGALAGGNDCRKRHVLRSSFPGRVLYCGRHFGFFHTGVNYFKSMIEKAGTQKDRCPNSFDLISVLDYSGPLHQRRRFTQAKTRRQDPCEPGSCRHSQVLALDTHSHRLFVAEPPTITSKPLGRQCQRRFAADDDLRPLHFISGLGGVATVGKKHRLRFREQQCSGAPAESTKIENVGKVGDQQGVKMLRRQFTSQTLLAAFMVHGRSLAISEGRGHARPKTKPPALITFQETGGWVASTSCYV